MSAAPVEVRAVFDVLAGTDVQTGPLPVLMRYDPGDPHAVTMLFGPDDAEPVEWLFARDLLAEVVASQPGAMVGAGDVRMWVRRGGERVAVALSSPDGDCVLEGPLHRLAYFVRRTFLAVPRGREGEHLDLDGGLARLLAGA